MDKQLLKHSLIPRYREMMGTAKPFTGRSIYAHLGHITKLITTSGAKTLLDYGCGQGRQYFEGRVHTLWGGIMPTLYDPAVEEHSQRPDGVFDGVICTDVMEHIPEDEIYETLDDIRSLTHMWAFFSVCCLPAHKTFPGTDINVHVTVRPPNWWQEIFDNVFDDGPKAHVDYITENLKKHEKPSVMVKCPERYTYTKQRRAAAR